jgi:hypothetical protein
MEKHSIQDRILANIEAITKQQKLLTEQQVKTDKQISELREQQAETTKLVKALTYNVDGIGKSNGDMAEETIYNILERDKTFAGIKFYKINRNVVGSDIDTGYNAEFDIIMLNGDTITLMETKYKVKKNDVNQLAKTKLNDFRTFFPKYKDYKIILGVAGMSFDKSALEVAKEKGIGVMKVVGSKAEYYTDGIKIH